MKTLSAREAKDGFGLMIDTARSAGADRKAWAWGRHCHIDGRI